MIEVSVNEIDGVRFLRDIKILEPDKVEHGVGIHFIPLRCNYDDKEVLRAIRLLGLREVGFDLSRRAFEYAEYPMPFYWYKFVEFLLKAYWAVIRWLYDNARVFEQIPPNMQFGWSYFTPYVWYKKLKPKG